MAFHKNIPSAIILTRNSPNLLKRLLEVHADPVDSYWNGSHTWFTNTENNEFEWRLHPISGFEMPKASRPEELLDLALEGEIDIAHYWNGLEVFSISDEPCTLEELQKHIVETLGIEPDFIGLVDHESVGNDFERNAGKVSIINLLIEQIQAIELDS